MPVLLAVRESVTQQTVATSIKPRLSGPVDAVSTSELLDLLGEHIIGASEDGVQLWATPTSDDGLHVEFMDRTGAHRSLDIAAEDFDG